MQWKFFEIREIREAKAFAASGGIAIHRNNVKFRGHDTCHMLAKDRETLIEAGNELGMKPQWIHKDHYDLFAGPMRKAISKCRTSD